MGYTRDKDAATRGAGAIAARDNANPTAAARRARAKRIATARRDRALAHLTYGQRGGLALGAISKYNASILQSITAPVISSGGGGLEVPVMPPIRTPTAEPLPLPPGPKPIPRPPGVQSAWTKLAALGPSVPLMQPVLPSGAVLVSGIGLPSSGVVGVSSPGVIVDPIPGSSTSVPGSKVTGGAIISGGGGGGAGISIKQPDLPDVEDASTGLPDVAPAKSALNPKTLAIVGALGIGAYLLFKRKKRQP